MTQDNIDLICIGGGYAGLAAAARAAQLGLNAVVLERGAEELDKNGLPPAKIWMQAKEKRDCRSKIRDG